MKELDLMGTMSFSDGNEVFRLSKKNKKMKNHMKNFNKELQLQHKKNKPAFISEIEKKEIEKQTKIKKTEHAHGLYMEHMQYIDKTKQIGTKENHFIEEMKVMDKNKVKKEMVQSYQMKQDSVKEDVLKMIEQALKTKQDMDIKVTVPEKEGISFVEIDFQKKKEMHWKINDKGEKMEIIETRKTFHPMIEKQEMGETEKHLKEKGKEFLDVLEGYGSELKAKKHISSDMKQQAIKEIKETFEMELKSTNRLHFSFDHDEFGRVETQIQKENDHVKVVMKVVNDEQKEKVEQIMQELQKELKEQDIQIEIDVQQQEEKEKQPEQQETFIKQQNSQDDEEKSGKGFEQFLNQKEEE